MWLSTIFQVCEGNSSTSEKNDSDQYTCEHAMEWVSKWPSKTRSPDDQGQKTFAFIAMPSTISALYGKNSMARARQAQTKDSGKIRKAPCRAESEQRLRGPINASS
jgi:hypothetical protein